MSELHFSIDLEAELEKITQRQSLNAVHYLVQLIRKALQTQPRSIEIRIKRRALEFQHDGLHLSQQEMEAIAMLLDHNPIQTSAHHKTLTLLERQYGIALLTILLRFDQATLFSAHRVLEKKGKFSTLSTQAESVAGFRLLLRGKDRQPKDEQREVVFFCAGAKVPILINGKAINQAITLTPCLLKKSFSIANKTYQGHGEIGIPAQGDYSEFWFYKNGVRAAMKQFSPRSGNIVHGWWNLESDQHEINFEYTIETGERHLFEQTNSLYFRTFEEFTTLSDAAKHRLRKMIFQWSPAEWFVDLLDLPVFHSSAGPWTLRLRDLIALNKRFLGIPYVTPGMTGIEADYPILDLHELNFLTEHLRLSVRRLQVDAFEGHADIQSTGLLAQDLAPDALAFLKALDSADPVSLHGFHRSPKAEQRGKTLLLPLENPRVMQMIKTADVTSAELLLWKYRNLGRLKRGH